MRRILIYGSLLALTFLITSCSNQPQSEKSDAVSTKLTEEAKEAQEAVSRMLLEEAKKAGLASNSISEPILASSVISEPIETTKVVSSTIR